MGDIGYHGHRCPTAIIQHEARLHVRFPPSYRHVEDFLAERSVSFGAER
jgi:transposase-like protein